MGAFVDRDWDENNKCGDKITSLDEWNDSNQWFGNTNPYFAKVFPEWFKPDGTYNHYGNWQAEVSLARQQGRIPYINWEAHGETVDGNCWWGSADRVSRNIIAEINSGIHDAFLADAAEGMRDEKVKIIVDLFHEMNGSWYDWSPCKHANTSWEDWRNAYKHVVDIFRGRRAPFIEPAANVEFTSSVWFQKPDNPDLSEPWFCEDTFAGEPTMADLYIPGYMDWVGVDIYGGENASFSQLLDIWYDDLVATGRPIVIGEMGVAPHAGKAAWMTEFQDAILNRYPMVKGFNWFDINKAWINGEANWMIDAGGHGPHFDQLMRDPRLVGAFGSYEIKNGATQRCLNMSGEGVALSNCDSSADQIFTLTDLGDYKMELRVLSTADCLDVAHASLDAGAVVQNYQCNATNAQIWTLDVIEYEPLQARFIAEHSAYCLAPSVAADSLVQVECNNAADQVWHLQRH